MTERENTRQSALFLGGPLDGKKMNTDGRPTWIAPNYQREGLIDPVPDPSMSVVEHTLVMYRKAIIHSSRGKDHWIYVAESEGDDSQDVIGLLIAGYRRGDVDGRAEGLGTCQEITLFPAAASGSTGG